MEASYAFTKMSSKGQIVIPSEMRKDIAKNEQLLIIKTKDSLWLKRVNKMELKKAEDEAFSKLISSAWKSYDKGEFTSMNYDAFLEEVKKWSKQSLAKNSKKSSSK